MFTFTSYNNVDLVEPQIEGKRGSIHLGNWQSVKDLTFLKTHKITHIVTALPKNICEMKDLTKLGIVQYQVPCDDSPEFDINPFLHPTADFIQVSLQQGNVLVHCAAGISRSVTCLMAYYIKYREMNVEVALSFIRQRRSCASPNHGFLKILKAFEEENRKH